MEDVKTALKQKALESLYEEAKTALHSNQGNWTPDGEDGVPQWVENVFCCANDLLNNGSEMMGAELLAGLMEAAATAPTMLVRMRTMHTVLSMLRTSDGMPSGLMELLGDV